MPIPQSAKHSYTAALGWFELGNYTEAFAELENLPPQHRACQEVMELRCRMYRHLGKWRELEMLAHGCYESSSHDVTFLSHWLWALMKLGRNERVAELLVETSDANSFDCEFCYTAGCVMASLNNPGAARMWLTKAFTLSGDPDKLRLRGLDQPELEKLWMG